MTLIRSCDSQGKEERKKKEMMAASHDRVSLEIDGIGSDRGVAAARMDLAPSPRRGRRSKQAEEERRRGDVRGIEEIRPPHHHGQISSCVVGGRENGG
uniref:Uncharacterized protein n=1 Tax=Arundo donax TaxID=35708 RepID=A0A0A8XN90_ARUDO